MGDVDKRNAQLFVDAFEFQLHVLTQAFVEGAQRLVHQQDAWAIHQRPGECDTLLLAAGQLRRVAVLEAFQARQCQRLLDPNPGFGGRYFAQVEGEGDVLGHAHVREQGIALENHAHVALVGRQFADVVAVHEDPATVWRVKTGKHHQSGGLARTAGAEQGQKFALADV
ncbi:hypothetical protein D3C72_1548960 [compost metagenome]